MKELAHHLAGLVANEPRETAGVEAILNNSFGMLGINSVVIVKKLEMTQ